MTNLVPIPQWDEVREIQKTDAVIGGIEGAANIANQQLLNCIAWIKEFGVGGHRYDPQKHYRPNEIVCIADNDDNPLVGNYYEAYHPDGCKGKDPRDPTNRPDGWTDTNPAHPYYWIKIGKWLELPPVGVPIPYQKTLLNQNLIKYRNDGNLHKDKYWRLAAVYPQLVSGNIIAIEDLRAEFIRGLDDGRGVDTGRMVGSAQGDAIRNITGSFEASLIYQNDVSTGVFHSNNNNTVRTNAPAATWKENSRTEGIWFDADRVVPTANENRPRNIAMLYATRF